MSKFVNDLNMDALINRVKENATDIQLCNGQPANFNEAITNKGSTVPGGGTARRLGTSTMSTASFTGPSNSTESGLGRKMTVNQFVNMDIDVTSTGADHVSITSSTGTELLLVTTIASPQDVVSGNTATLNAFDHTVEDAT